MDYDTGMLRVRGFTDKIPYIFFFNCRIFQFTKIFLLNYSYKGLLVFRFTITLLFYEQKLLELNLTSEHIFYELKNCLIGIIRLILFLKYLFRKRFSKLPQGENWNSRNQEQRKQQPRIPLNKERWIFLKIFFVQIIKQHLFAYFRTQLICLIIVTASLFNNESTKCVFHGLK